MTRRKLRRNAAYFRGMAMVASDAYSPCNNSEKSRVAENYDAGRFMSSQNSTIYSQHPTALDFTIYSSSNPDHGCKTEIDWEL